MRPAVPNLDLDALCRLARLAPGPALRRELEARIANVLAAFAELPDAAPDHSEARAVLANPTALRADVEGPCLPLQQVLGNAERTAADCFLTPRVVEG